MSRFAILHHDGIPDPHFDLLIELTPGASLATWRSPIWPIFEPTDLVKLRDHRRAYLDYEGEISGGRGFARRMDSGSVVVHRNTPGEIEVSLDAVRLVLRHLEEDKWVAVRSESTP